MLSKKNLQKLFKIHTATVQKEKQNFPKKEGKIRIMTFNVHNWQNYEGVNSMDSIFCVIFNSGADVVGINEGLYFGKTTKNKVYEYATLLGYKYIIESNRTYGINLLLSKYPVISHKLIPLGKDPICNENRYAIKATICVENTNINILLTHLDVWDETEETRLNQTKIIFREIDSSYILMGDLNSLRKADYDKEEWKTMTEESIFRQIEIQHKVTKFIENNKFIDCFIKINKICPKVSVWSMRRVDYIYIGNNFPHNLLNCDIFPTIASDHYPIFIDIDFKKQTKK